MKKSIELGLITLVIAIMGLSGGFVNFANAQGSSLYNFVRINESGSPNIGFPNIMYVCLGVNNTGQLNYSVIPQFILSGSTYHAYLDFFNYSQATSEVGNLVYNISVTSYTQALSATTPGGGHTGISAITGAINLYNASDLIFYIMTSYLTFDSSDYFIVNFNFYEYLVNPFNNTVSLINTYNIPNVVDSASYDLPTNYYINFLTLPLGGGINVFAYGYTAYFPGGYSTDIFGLYYANSNQNIDHVQTNKVDIWYPIMLLPIGGININDPNYVALFAQSNGNIATVWITYPNGAYNNNYYITDNLVRPFVVTPNGLEGADSYNLYYNGLFTSPGSSSGNYVFSDFAAESAAGSPYLYYMQVFYNNNLVPQNTQASITYSLGSTSAFISPLNPTIVNISGTIYNLNVLNGVTSGYNYNTQWIYFNPGTQQYTYGSIYTFENPPTFNLFWDGTFFYYLNNNQLYIGIYVLGTPQPPVIPVTSTSSSTPSQFPNATLPSSSTTYNETLVQEDMSAFMATGAGMIAIFIIIFLPALLLMVYLGIAGFIGGLAVGVFMGVLTGKVPLWGAIFMAILIVFFIYFRSGNPLNRSED